MNAERLFGISDRENLSPDKYNYQINKWVEWWNDHDNGVRAWTKFRVSDASLASINGTFIGLGRNRFINGETLIDQANGGASLTVNGAGPFYSIDQFTGYGVAASGVYTLIQDASSPPTGFQSSLKVTCSTADASIAAGDLYVIQVPVEGYSVRDFLLGTSNAKTFTLSFWVKSSLTGIFTGSLSNGGAGGSNRYYPFEYTISSASTWEQKTVTVVGDTGGTWLTTTGIGLVVILSLAIGSTYQGTANTWNTSQVFGTANQVNFMSSNTTRTFAVTGFQLELGSTATAFEYRPFDTETRLCQRYYQKSYALGTAPGTNTAVNHSSTVAVQINAALVRSCDVVMATEMRIVPTMTFYTDGGTSGSWTWRSAAGVDTARTTTAGTASDRGFAVQQGTITDLWGFGQWTADARL